MTAPDHQQPPLPAPDHDGDRFTVALAADVKAVLERHGYQLPTDQATRHRAIAETLAALGYLVNAFEGHTPTDPTTTRPTMSSCPTWCTAEGEHTLHHRLVGRQGDITVTLRQSGDQSGDSLPEVATPDGTLTLAAAHFLGQALIAGGQDAALGELLLQAADLLKEAR